MSTGARCRLQPVHATIRVNDVTLVAWTNVTLSLDYQHTANTFMLKVLDQIYAVSPLQGSELSGLNRRAELLLDRSPAITVRENNAPELGPALLRRAVDEVDAD